MTDDNLAKQIGNTVRDLRTQQGLSQEELADKCGVHRTYIGAVERGEKNVTVKTISKVTESLGVSLSSFFSKVSDER